MSSSSASVSQAAGAESIKESPWHQWRTPLLVIGPLLVLAALIYWYVVGGRFESTDDAYVMSAHVAISSNVAGRVVELKVRNNQLVKRGDVLFRLDDEPFHIANEEAVAQLNSAMLQVKSLKATYLQRRSDLAAAQDTLTYQGTELERQQRLFAKGIASRASVEKIQHAVDEARGQVASTQHEIGAVVAQLGGNPNVEVNQHPLVQQAQALLDRAKLNLSYALIHAPSDGVVTKVEQLQVGSYVAASAPLFALVSNNDVWLEANFKEDQLGVLRVGQTATIKIDSYPGKTFAGKVASISPGTGSQFSVLPPENATGNWVKVVQRVPVRIEFDRLDSVLAIQAGLSATVRVDTKSLSTSSSEEKRDAVLENQGVPQVQTHAVSATAGQ
jgi:membrane fusion protein, multidrug efflux system